MYLLTSLITFESQVELGDLQQVPVKAGRNSRTRAVPCLRRLTCSAVVIVGAFGFPRKAQPCLIWKTLQNSVSWQGLRRLLRIPASVRQIHSLGSSWCAPLRRAGCYATGSAAKRSNDPRSRGTSKVCAQRGQHTAVSRPFNASMVGRLGLFVLQRLLQVSWGTRMHVSAELAVLFAALQA